MRFLNSSIGKKIVMSISGLFLIVFLIIHLAGNLLLYFGQNAFNLYAHKLESTPLIFVLEAGLIAGFFLNIYQSIKLTIQSRKARTKKYAQKKGLGKSTFFSSNMFLSG